MQGLPYARRINESVHTNSNEGPSLGVEGLAAPPLRTILAKDVRYQMETGRGRQSIGVAGSGGPDRRWVVRLADLARGLSGNVEPRRAAELAATAACMEPSDTVLVFKALEHQALLLRAGVGPLASAMSADPWCTGLSFPEWVLRTDALTVSPDISVDARTPCLRERGATHGSAIGLPIHGGGQTIGVLVLVRAETGQLAEEDLAGLQAVVDILGTAVEQERLRERAEKQVRQLVALQEVSRLLTAEVDPETVLTIIVDVAASLFDLDLCSLLIYGQSGELRVRAAHGLPEDLAAALAWPVDRPPDVERFRSLGYPSAAVFPVLGREEALGYLVVGAHGDRVDESVRSPLATWANLAGVALENSRLMTEVVQTQQEMAEALVAVMGAQGVVSPGVAWQRARLASAVGDRMGMTAEAVRDAYLAALIADVQVNHPDVAGLPVSGSRRLERVWSILRDQAERWDGKCPGGLQGEEIPLGARILSVVRAYVDALAPEAGGSMSPSVTALLQVKAGAGQSWDPRVVSVLEAAVWSNLSLTGTAGRAPEFGASLERPRPGERSSSESLPYQAAAPGQQPETGPWPDLSLLTQREQEILALVAQGLSNREIATRLFLSEATVKTHVSRVLQKLGLPDRTKAAVYALQAGASAIF